MANELTDIKETLEDIVADVEHKEDATAQPKPKAPASGYDKVALVALIIAVIAWAILLIPNLYSGYVSLGVGVLAIIVSIFGLKSKRRGWRDTAITALIAATVLTIVLLAFIIVIYVGLNSI